MAIMVPDPTITVPTDTDMGTGTGTGHIGGAGTTGDITDAGTTDVDMVEDITVADTPADMVTATDAIDPQRRILGCPPVETLRLSLAD
jgi:hypothetical protein